MRNLFFFIFILWFLPGWSQSFQPLTRSIGPTEKIIIRGYRGKLRIVPGHSNVLKVEGKKLGKDSSDQWTFQMEKKENVVEISVKNSLEQKDWEKIRSRDRIPDFEIKVTAPFRPMEIFWDEGQVLVSQWNESLSIQMTHGYIDTKGGKGPLMLQLINGKIKVSDHKGDVGIQSFSGKVFIKKTKGALDIDNHSAIYEVSGHWGTLGLRNYSGSVTTHGTRGSCLAGNINGKIHLNGFEGSFEGDFKGGSLNAKTKSLQNFVVKSEEASVVLKVPRRSGAKVSLQSQKGRIVGPRYLRKIRKGRWLERRGRLKGKDQGHIKIVSKYGEIVLK